MSAILFSLEQQHSGDSSSSQQQQEVGENVFEDATAYAQHCADVCEEVLGHKMTALDLNDVAVLRHQHNCNDGSDSGVEIATTNVNVTSALQRALSSNSGGYASSNGGLDETTQGLNMSCDSSMISCSSDLYEVKTASSAGVVVSRLASNYECCSENGSESSSVTGSMAAARRSNSVRKKVALFEPNVSNNGAGSVPRASKERDCNPSTSAGQPPGGVSQQQVRPPRLSNLKRTASLPRPTTCTPHTREKSTLINAKTPSATTTPCRTLRTTKPQKPDSLPNALSRTQSISMQRLIQRTPSLSRARTPGTPSDDGRWPGVTNNMRGGVAASKRGSSVTPELGSLKIRSNMLASIEAKTLSCNPYSTLPRRRKQKSVEDLSASGGRGSRSSSITRDSRMTSSVVVSSRKSLVSSFATPTQTKMLPPATVVSKSASAAAARRLQSSKTRIYHETSVQTALTYDDLERAFAGQATAVRPVDAPEQRDQQTQSDIRDRELERLRDEVRQMAQREHELSAKLQCEREEKLAMQRELHLNTERVMGMLDMAGVAGTPTSDDGGGGGTHDSLLMLESQIQMSGHELNERQQEIGHLRRLCRSLQHEMERSLEAQERLLQEKSAIEQESCELQDFLQHEKAAMCDALKEIETNYMECRQQLASHDEEVKVLRDECRHLVRLNEQRRQENRMLQTKYCALETKSKELIVQQNSSVSGASAALSGLHMRLDNLVEQLVSSYSISEQDLEDIGFQNETQTNSGSISCDGSNECENQQLMKTTTNSHDMTLHFHHHTMPQLPSDGSLSPQRNQSFIAAVISAIRNATTPSGKRLLAARNCKRTGHQISNGHNGHGHQNNNHNEQTVNGDDSDSTEMLDSETEPCLMMDNVLEDVTMPDSHSHNMVSSCTGMISQIDVPSELVNVATGDESLHNLSQAIANRQQMEQQMNAMALQKVSLQLNPHDNSVSEEVSCHDSVAEMPSLAEYCSAQAVVDQVIEVDCLVTKLLKVLRLIQMDNDNCIQQLIVDKNKLQLNKEDMLEKLKDLQDANIKLQDELMDATQELMLKSNDLTSTKAEMQRHRNEIDRLTEDICNLSTLCSNYKKLSPTTEFPPMPIQQQLLVPSGELDDAATEVSDNDDVAGILNLLKIWLAEGQLKDARVRDFFGDLHEYDKSKRSTQDNGERLRIYANQLQNVLAALVACDDLDREYPALQQLRKDIEIVKLNADWADFVDVSVGSSGVAEDVNANENAVPLQAN